MNLTWNRFFRSILIGPIVRLLFPLKIVGLEKLPKDRPVILAIGPHCSEFESFIIASHLPLDARFFIKASYVKGRSLVATFMRKTGQIPIDRLDGGAMEEAIDKGVMVLEAGLSVLIYPEATRYYDGLLHPGGPIVARIAWRARQKRRAKGRPAVDVYPVGSQGFLRVQPKGAKFPRPFRRATIVIGDAMAAKDYAPPKPRRLLMNPRALEASVSRDMTAALMINIAANAQTTQSSERAVIKDS